MLARSNYYVYQITHKGAVIYIGKGTGDRDESHLMRPDWVDKDWSAVRVDHIHDNLTSDEAFSIEGAMIDYYMPFGNLENKVRGLTPQKRIPDTSVSPEEVLRRRTANAEGDRTPTPEAAVKAMITYLNGFARPLSVLIVGDKNAKIFTGVRGLGHDVALVDDDSSNSYVLNEVTFDTGCATYSGDFLKMPIKRRYDVILMNPPFNVKDENGKTPVKSLWKKFADKALTVADEVFLIAPKVAKLYDRLVLENEIKFNGQENEATVIVWNRSGNKKWGNLPRFDVNIRAVADGHDRKLDIEKVIVKNLSGEPKAISKVAYNRYKTEDEAMYIRFYKTGPKVVVSKELIYGPYQISGPDARKCAEWLKTEEGINLVSEIASSTAKGLITVLTSDQHSEAYNINRIIGRLRDEP